MTARVTRWTPQLLSQVRAHAAAGHSMRETAAALGLLQNSLCTKASLNKISFHGKRGRASTLVTRTAARQALDREIAAARREAALAPLYRRGEW